MKRISIVAGAILVVVAAIAAYDYVTFSSARADLRRQHLSHAVLADLSYAIEQYGMIHERYPTYTGSADRLRGTLERITGEPVKTRDGFDHPVYVDISDQTYALHSFGKDGVPGRELEGPDADAAFSNGTWVKLPETGASLGLCCDEVARIQPWRRVSAGHREGDKIFTLGRWYSCTECHAKKSGT